MLKKLLAKIRSLSKSKEPTDPSIFDDPVAEKTGWAPIKRGGANFCTHKLFEVNLNRYEFKASFGARVFYLIFFFIGVGVLCGFFYMIFTKGISDFFPSGLFLLLFGSIFGTVGGCLYYFGTKPIVFDKQSGCYWKGKHEPHRIGSLPPVKSYAMLEDIHALQLVSEYCTGDDSSYYSYELNLVLSDAERINVIDHGKLNKIREDANILADFLEKPLWDAT